MLLNVHPLVVLDHIFCSNKNTFKMTSTVDDDRNDAFMGINDNSQEAG